MDRKSTASAALGHWPHTHEGACVTFMLQRLPIRANQKRRQRGPNFHRAGLCNTLASTQTKFEHRERTNVPFQGSGESSALQTPNTLTRQGQRGTRRITSSTNANECPAWSQRKSPPAGSIITSVIYAALRLRSSLLNPLACDREGGASISVKANAERQK
eukprot:6190650-Pleurochrysis_carterae.AAC.1